MPDLLNYLRTEYYDLPDSEKRACRRCPWLEGTWKIYTKKNMPHPVNGNWCNCFNKALGLATRCWLPKKVLAEIEASMEKT